MGFFDSLRRVLTGDHSAPDRHPVDHRVASVWGLDENEAASTTTTPAGDRDRAVDTGLYDRKNWQKKLKRILAELPDSKPQWAELMAEARALHFEADWIRQCEREEFQLLIRRAVSDRHFSETEHRKLDLARELIGISEAEAETTLHTIMAEAEKFFGKSVREG